MIFLFWLYVPLFVISTPPNAPNPTSMDISTDESVAEQFVSETYMELFINALVYPETLAYLFKHGGDAKFSNNDYSNLWAAACSKVQNPEIFSILLNGMTKVPKFLLTSGTNTLLSRPEISTLIVDPKVMQLLELSLNQLNRLLGLLQSRNDYQTLQKMIYLLAFDNYYLFFLKTFLRRNTFNDEILKIFIDLPNSLQFEQIIIPLFEAEVYNSWEAPKLTATLFANDIWFQHLVKTHWIITSFAVLCHRNHVVGLSYYFSNEKVIKFVTTDSYQYGTLFKFAVMRKEFAVVDLFLNYDVNAIPQVSLIDAWRVLEFDLFSQGSVTYTINKISPFSSQSPEYQQITPSRNAELELKLLMMTERFLSNSKVIDRLFVFNDKHRKVDKRKLGKLYEFLSNLPELHRSLFAYLIGHININHIKQRVMVLEGSEEILGSLLKYALENGDEASVKLLVKDLPQSAWNVLLSEPNLAQWNAYLSHFYYRSQLDWILKSRKRKRKGQFYQLLQKALKNPTFTASIETKDLELLIQKAMEWNDYQSLELLVSNPIIVQKVSEVMHSALYRYAVEKDLNFILQHYNQLPRSHWMSLPLLSRL